MKREEKGWSECVPTFRSIGFIRTLAESLFLTSTMALATAGMERCVLGDKQEGNGPKDERAGLQRSPIISDLASTFSITMIP